MEVVSVTFKLHDGYVFVFLVKALIGHFLLHAIKTHCIGSIGKTEADLISNKIDKTFP